MGTRNSLLSIFTLRYPPCGHHTELRDPGTTTRKTLVAGQAPRALDPAPSSVSSPPTRRDLKCRRQKHKGAFLEEQPASHDHLLGLASLAKLSPKGPRSSHWAEPTFQGPDPGVRRSPGVHLGTWELGAALFAWHTGRERVMEWCPAHLSSLSPASPWLWALMPGPSQAVTTMRRMMSSLSQLQLLLRQALRAHPFSEPEPHTSGGVSGSSLTSHQFSFSFSFRFPKASLGASGRN